MLAGSILFASSIQVVCDNSQLSTLYSLREKDPFLRRVPKIEKYSTQVNFWWVENKNKICDR